MERGRGDDETGLQKGAPCLTALLDQEPPSPRLNMASSLTANTRCSNIGRTFIKLTCPLLNFECHQTDLSRFSVPGGIDPSLFWECPGGNTLV